MIAAILILVVLPYYPIPQNTLVYSFSLAQQIFFWIFSAIFFILLILGGKPAEAPYVLASQIFTFLYFAYFLCIIPAIPFLEKRSVHVQQ